MPLPPSPSESRYGGSGATITLDLSGAPPNRWETTTEWVVGSIYEAAKQLIVEVTESIGADPTVKEMHLGESLQSELDWFITVIAHDTFENAFPGFQVTRSENTLEATIHVA